MAVVDAAASLDASTPRWPLSVLRGAWRTEVGARIRDLQHRFEAARKHLEGAQEPAPIPEKLETTLASEAVTIDVSVTPPTPAATTTAELKTHERAVEESLALARTAITYRSPSRPPTRWWYEVRDWWSGARVTAGWESVHDAEAHLAEIESPEAVRTSLPRLLAWMRQVMEADEPRKRYEEQLGAMLKTAAPLDRTAVSEAIQDVIGANGEQKANQLSFRNMLIVGTSVLAALLLTIAIWHAIDPQFVSLCEKGSKTARNCVSGGTPGGADVFEIALVGAIGGLLSLAATWGGLQAPPSRFNVRPQQAWLKVVAGAATGLAGVLVIQSNVIVAPAKASEALFLVYALVFGFSQQLFTRFVDKRANVLLGEEESKSESSSKASKAKA